MADEWAFVPVKEVAASVSNTHPRSVDRLIFLNTSDVLHGKVLHRTYSDVSGWPGQAKKSIQRDDILFSEIRPANGRWAFIDFDAIDFVASTKLMVLRPRTDKIVPRFLYHFLTSEETTSWLQHLAESRSGTFPQITFDQVAELQIGLPPLEAQIAISGFLDFIDEKIYLNQRMNETLEATARAIFKDWFVDFGPTRAKMKGHTPYLVADIWSLFPDRLDDEGKPEGWKVFRLEEISQQHTRTLTPSAMPDTLFEHFSLPAFDKGQSPALDFGVAIKSNKTVVPPEAVLLSKLNPEITRVWLPEDAGKDHPQIASTEFLAFTANRGFGRSLLFCLFRELKFREMLQTMVTGTSKSHQRISPPDLMRQEVITGNLKLFLHFEASGTPLLGRVRANHAETRTLAATRDLLLPKLMSGEIPVREVEKLVGEAT